MDSRSYCKSIVRKSGSNFYYSFFFLGGEKRRAINAVYAFARTIDDIADGNWEEAISDKQLLFWRGEIERCYDGISMHPLTKELKWAVGRFEIPKEYFERLLDGVTKDIKQNRWGTFDELKTYCYCVASVVGLICLEIFGAGKSADIKDAAINLGFALQLTNILRDVGTDALRGRIYLPKEDMEHFGVSEESILRREFTPQFKNLMTFERERAYSYFEKAWKGFKGKDLKKLLPAAIMGRIYFRLLEKIEKEGFDTLNKKVKVSKLEKIFIAAGSFLKAF